MKTADTKSTCCVPAVETCHAIKDESTNRHTSSVHANMVALPGGSFDMGANDSPHREDGEGPIRCVIVSSFSLSATVVTNTAFARFIDATGYKTIAEREGTSYVFHLFVDEHNRKNCPIVAQTPWWLQVAGACWRWPEGLCGNNAMQRPDHPAIHIALPDALAYCHWTHTRLPSEAEWEFAARGGLERKSFPWGNVLEQEGQHHSNVWQGDFPTNNSREDGYEGTAPAMSYRPNGYGLYNMTGNVWEWTSDRFTTLHSPRPVSNPTGPLNGSRFVAKGGSYLCHASYCTRYRTSSRQALDPLTMAGNIGFRVAAD